MKVGVPKEIIPGERRVALVPEGVRRLIETGMEVLVEAGAGEAAFFSDDHYREAGAQMLARPVEVFGQSGAVLKVRRPVENPALGQHETQLFAAGSVAIGLFEPMRHPEVAGLLSERRVTAFSMDLIPRIARAQAMDALSSQASLAGYKAALIAADSLGKLFPLMTTAAGTVAPARVLVMGAGVAGLQAIATARRLGAQVLGYDIRAAAREQVESLGATFVSPGLAEDAEAAGGYAQVLAADAQQRERDRVLDVVRSADVVITTALVPGRRAPILVTAAMVKAMRPGSVIVDLAAEAGGNCELTEPGRVVVRDGIAIHGPPNLPSSIPVHASQMYSTNISNLLLHLAPDGRLALDFDDVITRDSCITHDGEILHAATRAAPAPTAARPGSDGAYDA